MAAVNRISSNGQKGLLRQMPGLGVGRIVPSTAASALSVFTQRGAYPGVPVLTSSVSSMFMKASGTIPEDELAITVETLHGGLVGWNEAQWVYSQAIDSAARPVINTGAGNGSIDTVRGWEWPAYVAHNQALVFDDAPEVGQPSACTLSDGRIYQFYVSADGSTVDLLLKVRDPLTGSWADPVTVYSTTDTTRSVMCPAPIVFPDDRVVVYFFNYLDEATTFQIQARVVSPTDYTVGDYEVYCLKTTAATATYGAPTGDSQLRAALSPSGSVVLVCSLGTTAERLLQFGSYDYGHSFAVVGAESGSIHHRLPDIVYTGGLFVLSYVVRAAGVADEVHTKVLTHWFDSIADVSDTTYRQALTDNGGDDPVLFGNALCVSTDGIVYNVNAVGDVVTPAVFFGVAFVSTDQGSTWTQLGYDAGSRPSWAYLEAPANETCAFLRNLCATYQGNRVYIGSCFTKDSQESADNDLGSLLGFCLGGSSNQQQAFLDSADKVADEQLGYDLTHLGFVAPDFNGWTKTTSGTASYLAVNDRSVLNTSDGGKLYYNRTGGTSAFASVEWAFVSAVYNTMVAGDVGVEITVDDATNRYKLGVYYLSAGGIRLRDLVAATTIADIPIVFATEMTYRVEMSGSKFQLFYRPTDSDEDQAWERAVDPFSGDTYAGYTLTSTAGGSVANVLWGHFFAVTTGATGDAISDWSNVKVNFGTNLAASTPHSGIKRWFDADYIDYAATDDFHHGYPFVAAPVWVTDGVYVTATGGPTYLHDEWEITPAFQYPIANLLPEGAAAPGEMWESTTDDDDITVCFLAGQGDTDAAYAAVLTEWPGNESIALCVLFANFRTGSLYGVKSDNSEVKILDVDLTRFSGLTFDNHGNTTKVTAGGGTTYVAPGELVGCYLINSGETTPKQITENTEGQLNTATKQATIWFEASLTEDQGVDADAGNLIFGTSGFFVCHDPPANQFKAYLFKIPAQETADGYFRCKIMFGPLTVFGIPPAYGFSTTLPQDNVLRNKTNAGHTETRVYNGLPRVKALAWEALDQTMLDQAAPDYIQFPDGDEPAALYDDAARQLYGLMKQLEGANELVVYCDAIPEDNNTSELRPERYVYGRATSEFQESNRVGHEGVSELVQVTNFVIEEEE